MSAPKHSLKVGKRDPWSQLLSTAKPVANFSVQYLQFLNEHAEATQKLPQFAHDLDQMLHLYGVMKKLHLFDRKVLMLHRTGKMGTYTGTLGQEAVGVGAASCLTDKDVFVPYYRSTTDLYMRGVRLHEILLYWGGDERGSDYKDPRLKYDLPIPISIATQLPHAAGIAKTIQLRKQKGRAVLTMIGDGGTSEGDFYETLNVAGAWNLPLVIVINNNQWALSETNTQQTSCETLAQKAIAGGFEGLQVDGNDVIAVKAATDAALHKARNGGGPTLIEAITYRLCSHTTIDDMNRYAKDSEQKSAWSKEPLKRLYQFLEKEMVINEEIDRQLEQSAKQEIDEEVEIFLNTELPKPEDMFDYLYAHLPTNLQEQRDEVINRESEK